MNKLAFGCSHTYGTGNQPEEAWPALLGATNQGVPGSSTDLIARTCEARIQEHGALVVYALWPDWTRFEYNGRQILPNTHPHLYKDRSDDWLRQNREDRIIQVETVCARYDCLLVSLHMGELSGIIDHQDQWPPAQDNSHFGPLWHQWVADLFRVRESFKGYARLSGHGI
jgi:hypothetical protein